MRAVSTLALFVTLSACAPEGSSAYVSFNIPPDTDCQYTPSTDLFIPIGQYDVLPSGAGSFCKQSYFMHLIVNSNLKSNSRDSTGRAEPNVLQITEADVRLMDKDKATLRFTDKDGNTDAALPNPFRVQTANTLQPSTSNDPTLGVVAIEAIPRNYATKLTGLADMADQILVEVQIYGTTTGDVDIDIRPFIYPVALCRGCLHRCQNLLGDTDESTVYGDRCVDNGAQDGRVCIDPDPDCAE